MNPVYEERMAARNERAGLDRDFSRGLYLNRPPEPSPWDAMPDRHIADSAVSAESRETDKQALMYEATHPFEEDDLEQARRQAGQPGR